MNKTFYIPMSFNVASFRKTKLMKKIGGTHFSSLVYAKDAQKQLKPQNFLIDTIFAGNFKRQPVYTPAVYAIFEVSLPDYIADSALNSKTMVKATKRWGNIFSQTVEPEHLTAIYFHVTEDLLHPAKDYVITKENGFMHEEIAHEVDARIIALERLAQAAARTPKSVLSLIKWNDAEQLAKFRAIYSHDGKFAEKPWTSYPHGLWTSLLYNLLGKCGLETALKGDDLHDIHNTVLDDMYESKKSFTDCAQTLIQRLKDGVSTDEQQKIQTFCDNIQQEVDNIWWNCEMQYVNGDQLGHVVVDFREPIMIDPDGYHGTDNTEMRLLRAFGNKTYMLTGDLREETLNITPGVEVYEAKQKFAEEVGGNHQEELTMFLTAIELIQSPDKLTRHYARHVRNDLFELIFNEYMELVFNFAFHERLYVQQLASHVEENFALEFRMRTSNAAIMLREAGETNPKAVVLGAEEAVAAMKRKYTQEDFSAVENTVKEHMSLFK